MFRGRDAWEFQLRINANERGLASLGGCARLLLAVWGVRFLLALSPTRLPREQEIGVDLRVLAFAATASLLAAVAKRVSLSFNHIP